MTSNIGHRIDLHKKWNTVQGPVYCMCWDESGQGGDVMWVGEWGLFELMSWRLLYFKCGVFFGGGCYRRLLLCSKEHSWWDGWGTFRLSLAGCLVVRVGVCVWYSCLLRWCISVNMCNPFRERAGFWGFGLVLWWGKEIYYWIVVQNGNDHGFI